MKNKLTEFHDTEWKIKVEPNNQSAKLINSSGEEMSFNDFASLMELFQNRLYDLSEVKYGHNKRQEPLDEFTKKRLDIQHYLLLQDENRGELRNIYEAYINRFLILDNYVIYKGRKTYEAGFHAVIGVDEAKKLLPLISKYIKEKEDQ